MKKMCVTLLVLAICVGSAQASMIAEWDNTALVGNEANAPANLLAVNVAAGDLARGAGGTATGFANTFALRDNNQGLSLATALANEVYFLITLEADSGYVLNLTNMFVRLTGQNSGAGNDRIFTLFSDATGFAEGDELATFTVTGTTATFNADLAGISELQGVSDVEFRLYVHGTGAVGQHDQNGIGHAFWADAEKPDLRFDGTVTAGGDPEPETPDVAIEVSAAGATLTWSPVDPGTLVTVWWIDDLTKDREVDAIELISGITDDTTTYIDTEYHAETAGFYWLELL